MTVTDQTLGDRIFILLAPVFLQLNYKERGVSQSQCLVGLFHWNLTADSSEGIIGLLQGKLTQMTPTI